MAFNEFTRRAGAPYDPDDLTRELNENFDKVAECSFSTLSDGEILTYDNSSGVWINSLFTESLALVDLSDIGDVSLSTLQDGEALIWDGSSNSWINGTASSVTDLESLTDTSLSTLTDGEVLTWDSSSNSWINAAASGVSAIDDLTDVSIATPADGEVLIYDSSSASWINSASIFEPVACKVTANSSTTLTASSSTQINYNTVTYDTKSYFDTSTDRFTPLIAGYYQVNFRIRLTSSGRVLGEVYKNGSREHYTGVDGTAGSCIGTATIYCNGSTDYLDVRALNTEVTSNSTTTDTIENYAEFIRVA